ncbi:MAG: hypothetical protein R3275_02390 [Saprospiraceae bacterium]|nr:hypothetical protein [Saprospiraceae bacterium]
MEYSVPVTFQPSTNTAITYRVRHRDISSSYDKMLNENNLNAQDVKTVRVRSAEIFPTGRNISYGILRKIDVSIFELSDPDDLLVIAEEYPQPGDNRSELPLLPGLPNVKPFVEQDFFGLDIGYVLRRPLSERIDNIMRIEFEAVGF